MADIEISPLPYNGGSLVTTQAGAHVCFLSENLYVTVFAQTNPTLSFLGLYSISNEPTGDPVVTLLKQRAFAQTVVTRARLWKLTDKRFMLYQGTDLSVYEITADNDIVKVEGSLTNLHNTYIYGTEANNVHGLGTYLHGKTISDNSVLFIQRASTAATPIVMFRVVYDPETKTLTKTANDTLLASATATHYWKSYIVEIPNSTKFLVYLHGGATTIAASTVTAMRLVDGDGTVTVLPSTAPSTVRLLVPLSESKILGFVTTRAYREYDGSTWGAYDTTFAAATVSGTNMFAALAMDDTYFLLASSTSGIETAANAFSVRIGRSLAVGFGQASLGTNASNGLAVTASFPYIDQCPIYNIRKNTYAVMGRTTTGFRITYLTNA